jgi:hypothetical protein
VSALANLRATAAALLGAAVLIEAVLTYRHQVRPRHQVSVGRTAPIPSGPQHRVPSTTHSAVPARPARIGPGGSARTATPTSL